MNLINLENMASNIRIFKRATKLFLRNILDSLAYYLGGKRILPLHIRRVVFVCKGNICRSAYAEYSLKALASMNSLAVESCGLCVDKEMPAPKNAIEAAKRFGLNLVGHRSRGLGACELENADLVLAMEFWQYRELLKRFPQRSGNIRLLREFCPFPENLFCNIHDPYGGNEKTFEKCFHQIDRSLANVEVVLSSHSSAAEKTS